MLVRNPYEANPQMIDNDEYLDYEELSREEDKRVFPPFFPPNNQPGPPISGPPGGPDQPSIPPQTGQPPRPPQTGQPPRPPQTGQPSGPPQTGQPSGPPQPGQPSGPPPNFTPQQSGPSTFKVSPGSIRPCRFQFVFIWLTNGNSFWAWLTNVDRTTASGFRWNGFRWVYFGVDLNRIAAFECFDRDTIDNDLTDDEYLYENNFYIEDDSRVFPPFSPPGGPGFGPGTGFGPGGNPSNPNAVPGPPPSFTPQQAPAGKSSNPNTLKVSPGSIRPCRFQFVYLWLTNGDSFWAWLTNIDRTTASGFRWNRFRWVYFGVSLNRIASFECFGRNIARNTDNVVSNLQTQVLAPMTFNMEYPFIQGMIDEDVENIINLKIIDTLNSIFLNQVLVPEKINFKKVESAYEVPLDSYGLLSIVMSLSSIANGESVPHITFDSLTVDLNTGNVYDFDDLFNSKFNYRSALSQIATNKAKEMNIKFVVPYQGITDNQKFYLTPEGLVLYYQVDEYAAASEGLFRITIPYNEITNYLYPGSPINKILNQANVISNPSSKPQGKPMPIQFTEGGTAMGPEYLGTYTGTVPTTEGGTAMGPEYLGTYTGTVSKNN